MSSRELSSWKTIAEYLGITVRTAQKWETERGLPIRRLPGGHGRVATTTTDLDRWKTSRPGLPTEATTFRWPVDRDMIAEVRFSGPGITPAHLSRLIEHLTLVKNAIE